MNTCQEVWYASELLPNRRQRGLNPRPHADTLNVRWRQTLTKFGNIISKAGLFLIYGVEYYNWILLPWCRHSECNVRSFWTKYICQHRCRPKSRPRVRARATPIGDLVTHLHLTTRRRGWPTFTACLACPLPLYRSTSRDIILQLRLTTQVHIQGWPVVSEDKQM